MGLAVAGGSAGCTGHDEATETERTPDDRPQRVTDTDYPPQQVADTDDRPELVTDTEDPVQWRVAYDAELAQPH